MGTDRGYVLLARQHHLQHHLQAQLRLRWQCLCWCFRFRDVRIPPSSPQPMIVNPPNAPFCSFSSDVYHQYLFRNSPIQTAPAHRTSLFHFPPSLPRSITLLEPSNNRKGKERYANESKTNNRAFDTVTDGLWDRLNRGRQWKDIRHRYVEAEE